MKPPSDSFVCGAREAEILDMVTILWTQHERLLEDAVAAIAEKLCAKMAESFEKKLDVLLAELQLACEGVKDPQVQLGAARARIHEFEGFLETQCATHDTPD